VGIPEAGGSGFVSQNMRRKDKLIENRADIDAIIAGSDVCRLALSVNDEPYLVPLSFGYDGDAIYVHTAKKGKKIDYFLANERVCFEFETNVRYVRDGTDACSSTFSFESVIGYGRISELADSDAKEYALRQITVHYGEAPAEFPKDSVRKVRVWKVSIDSVDGKRSPLKERS
jgi:nitroimidazol reductase NimA-like FMN-containing flavoprotein (pyridoxamine 5'-phosphate oxidase superfamily)